LYTCLLNWYLTNSFVSFAKMENKNKNKKTKQTKTVLLIISDDEIMKFLFKM